MIAKRIASIAAAVRQRGLEADKDLIVSVRPQV